MSADSIFPEPAALPEDAEAAVQHFALELVLSGAKDGAAWSAFRASPPAARLAVIRAIRSMARTDSVVTALGAAEWTDAFLGRHGR